MEKIRIRAEKIRIRAEMIRTIGFDRLPEQAISGQKGLTDCRKRGNILPCKYPGFGIGLCANLSHGLFGPLPDRVATIRYNVETAL